VKMMSEMIEPEEFFPKNPKILQATKRIRSKATEGKRRKDSTRI